MAETEESKRGKQHKKIVPVEGYKKADGIKVRAYRRSTPRPPKKG